METQDKKLDCSPKQGRLRIRLSDAYPLPVREALQKLALATHGCDQAVEYVLRLEREAFQYFRPIGHCFGENLDRWLAGQPDRLSRIEEIKQQVGAQREQVGTFTDRDKAPGQIGELDPAIPRT